MFIGLNINFNNKLQVIVAFFLYPTSFVDIKLERKCGSNMQKFFRCTHLLLNRSIQTYNLNLFNPACPSDVCPCKSLFKLYIYIIWYSDLFCLKNEQYWKWFGLKHFFNYFPYNGLFWEANIYLTVLMEIV